MFWTYIEKETRKGVIEDPSVLFYDLFKDVQH